MQEFPNFQNLKILNNTIFSKFSQNLSFYFRDLRSKKKLLQITWRITKKNFCWNRRNHGPNRSMTGCYRKYLPLREFINNLSLEIAKGLFLLRWYQRHPENRLTGTDTKGKRTKYSTSRARLSKIGDTPRSWGKSKFDNINVMNIDLLCYVFHLIRRTEDAP
jgi:hypothetical protein